MCIAISKATPLSGGTDKMPVPHISISAQKT